jgi:hypothetical protein
MTSVSRNMHMEAVTTLEVVRLLGILSMAPQVLGLSKNPIRGQKDSWFRILNSNLNKNISLPVMCLCEGSRAQPVW